MRHPRELVDGGFALITTLLLLLVVGALVMGAVILGSSQLLADRSWFRESNLVVLADAGLEIGRSYLNGDESLFPDSGFVAIEERVAVEDSEGGAIPGVTRSIYVGPTKIGSGREGVSGSIVSVVRDAGGSTVVRRQDVFQESFARYAYFTDSQDGNGLFAGGDHIWGPVHSNDQIRIRPTGTTFHDEVTSAQDVGHTEYGTFEKGYQEHSPVIPLPDASQLQYLVQQARAGHTAFSGDMAGGEGEATTRIEFVALDLNGDGDRKDEGEGFFRVYQSEDYKWVSAKPQPTPSCDTVGRGGTDCSLAYDLAATQNCGDYHGSVFVPAADHDSSLHDHSGLHAPKGTSYRCFLGGADEIWNGFVAEDGRGHWLPWDGSIDSRVRALRPDDAGFLYPISRSMNPEFRGVLYVDGKVIVSGEIRGRVTVVASGNIIFGDDITYVTDPAVDTCEDMAGYVSEQKVVVSHNTINAPWRPVPGEPYRTYDESAAEFVHGVILALETFTAEDLAAGSTSDQSCEGKASGRGCLYLTGGIIQKTPEALGLADGHGYVERYSYDRCAASRPPPFFPNTGMFVRGQYYQVDAAGFNISEYWDRLAPSGSASRWF